MFIETDYKKRPREAHYYLAKPNKQVIGSLHAKKESSISFKLGGISEMTIIIPYFIEENNEMVPNQIVALAKERMLVKAVVGKQEEWFVIDSIDEEGGDDESFSINAFSLGYELSDKLVESYEEESVNAQDLLNEVVKNTAWSVKSIDPDLLGTYGSMGESSTNGLDLALVAPETFNGIILWHTAERRLSFVNAEGYGQYRGMAVDYGRLLEKVSIKRESQNLVTRLYIEGSDGLGIQNINPTGQRFIEDFGYYMYPFERDSNGNVLKKSHFMSDALCHALLDQKALILEKADQIRTLVNETQTIRANIIIAESELTNLNLELDNILNLLDLAKATGDAALVAQRKTERDSKQAEVDSKESSVESLRVSLVNKEIELETLYESIRQEASFTQPLIDELRFYTKEMKWSDDRYIDEQELYDAALRQFDEFKIPSTVMTVDLVNFLKIVEEEYYWDKLVLGDFIKVKHPRMNVEYYARIIEIDYTFGDDESISITIANTAKNADGNDLAKIIKDSASASSLLSNSKYKWDKNNERMSLVEEMIKGEHNANERKILAGVNNSIEIGKRGMIVTSPQFPEERIVIQSGIIALSKNGGEDWQTAITPDGIVAERLMGQIIAGQNLLITNQAGSFIIDNNGVEIAMDSFRVISESGGNVIDNWNKNIDDLNTLRSEFTVASNKISLLVSETNEIKATEIASAISVTPEAIQLISSEVSMSGDDIVSQIKISPSAIDALSKSINLTGLVTFQAFDASIQSELNIYNGWRHPSNTTMINGGDIYTRSIEATAIKTEQLVVGQNIAMGPNATIDWGQVDNAPVIPTRASDIGAVSTSDGRLTRITSTGIYTGTVDADNIIGGFIQGVTFDATNAGMTAVGTSSSSVKMWAGQSYTNRSFAPFRVMYNGKVIASDIDIQGGSINISGSAKVGSNLTVGAAGNGWGSCYISMSGMSIYTDGWNGSISAIQGVSLMGQIAFLATSFQQVDFTNGSHQDKYFQVRKSSSVMTELSGNGKRLDFRGASGRMELFSNSTGYTMLRGYSYDGSGGNILKWVGNILDVRDAADNGWAQIRASNVALSSLRELKTDIQPFEKDALAMVQNTRVYDYILKGEEGTGKRNVGMIYDEAPWEVRAEDSINLYSAHMVLWRAVQQLSLQVQALKAQLDRR